MLHPFPNAIVEAHDFHAAADFLRSLMLPPMIAIAHLRAYGRYYDERVPLFEIFRLSVTRGRRYLEG